MSSPMVNVDPEDLARIAEAVRELSRTAARFGERVDGVHATFQANAGGDECEVTQELRLKFLPKLRALGQYLDALGGLGGGQAAGTDQFSALFNRATEENAQAVQHFSNGRR